MAATRPQENTTSNSTLPVCNPQFNSLYYTFFAFILFFALVGNGFICMAFCCRRKLRTVTNYFVVNLAVADCLVVMLGLLWMITDIFCVETFKLIPLLLQTLELIFSSASVVGLAVVSYDRFYAVNHALHYSSTMTQRPAVLTIAAVWVYSTITAFIRWGALEPSIEVIYIKVCTVVLFIFNFFIPFIVSAYCYIRIFLIAMLHLRHGVPANQLSDPLSKASTLRKQLKVSLNIFILAVPFLFMWNIYYGIAVYEVLCSGCFRIDHASVVDYLVSNLPQLVAAINPFIFIFLTKDVRLTAMMCLHCTKPTRRRREWLAHSDTYSTTMKYTTNFQPKRDDDSGLDSRI